jgi:type IV pilus assembly protein PilV
MLNRIPPGARRAQAGTSMMEVLISIVIVVLGLLGLAGLQSHATLAEMESFQRAQALTLLQDMVDRINANRLNAKSYITASPMGTDEGVLACAGTANHERDLCEWNNALMGASESAGGLKVGAMIGARGCVTETQPIMPREYQVTVVWQGIVSTKAPGTACGAGLYGDDTTRRAISATVKIACLQNNPASGVCILPFGP